MEKLKHRLMRNIGKPDPKLTIHLLSRVTVEFFRKTTKSRSKLSFANNGSKTNLVLTTTLVPSPMVITSCKRRSMFLQDTRPSSAASS
jgi:hypothetical protein